MLKRDDWTVLVIEHEDRLTRFGFEWFRLLLDMQGRRIIVVNEAGDDRADLVHDLVGIIYSFSARLYGQRRSQRAKAMAELVEEYRMSVILRPSIGFTRTADFTSAIELTTVKYETVDGQPPVNDAEARAFRKNLLKHARTHPLPDRQG